MTSTTQDPTIPDEQLAEAIAQRERSEDAWRVAQEAFVQLYQRHAAKLLAFLAARAGRADMEDSMQEVWGRIWQSLPTAFHGGNFRAWLYQIARNYVIDQSRKKRPERLDHDAELSDTRQEPPEELLAERERWAVLQRCLDRLSAEFAAVVRARLAGEAYPEICQRLSLKPERAHKMFFQAREQLQTCVERAMA